MQRTILGIDPGTGRLGWGVIKSEKQVNELIDCGLVETKANVDLSERLELIFQSISDVIKKYKVQEVAIEELFFVKNIKTGISVAHARGVVMLAAKLANVSIFEYKPNEIKLAISGFGHADKSQMTKMVKLHLKRCPVEQAGLEADGKWGKIKQDDTADAVAVAVTHAQMSKSKSLRNK